MKKFFFAIGLMVAVSGIIVAQQINGGASGNNRTTVDRQGRQIDLLSETHLSAQLQGAIDARHAKVGDRVILKTTEAIKQNGQVVIPKGAQLIGRVTDVQRQTNPGSSSQVGLLFDQIRSGSTEIPITASILSITQARARTQANDSSIDADVMGQSSASSRSSSPPRNNNGGLLSGVGNTVGGVVNTTGSTAGNVAGTTTNAVGSTVGATSHTAGNLSGSLSELQINQSTTASGQSGSTVSLTGSNLRIESGTTFNLAISNSAGARNR